MIAEQAKYQIKKIEKLYKISNIGRLYEMWTCKGFSVILGTTLLMYSKYQISTFPLSNEA